MIGFWNYTVWATYISLAAATVGIWLTLENMPLYGVICLMLSGFLDMFDGKIARTKKKRSEDEKRYGIQIDSLSDLVAFGVLPATIGIGLCDGEVSRALAMAVSIFYVLTALVRLAYFNVTEEARQKQTDDVRHHYLGLPVTSSALILPVVWCFQPLLGPLFPWIYLGVLTATAFLFITPFKLGKPGSRMLALMTAAGVILTFLLLAQKFGMF